MCGLTAPLGARHVSCGGGGVSSRACLSVMLLLTPMVRYQPTRPSRAVARCSSDEACAPNMTPAKSAVPWKKPESTWPLASSPSSLAAPSAAALHSFRRSGAWGVRRAFRALQA